MRQLISNYLFIIKIYINRWYIGIYNIRKYVLYIYIYIWDKNRRSDLYEEKTPAAIRTILRSLRNLKVVNDILHSHSTQFVNRFAMAKLILDLFPTFKKEQFCTIAVLLSILHSSAADVCGDKTFRKSPLHIDVEPAYFDGRNLTVPNKRVCSTKCYYDAMCSGFFYRYDGLCFLLGKKFTKLLFVKENGTQGFGK